MGGWGGGTGRCDTLTKRHAVFVEARARRHGDHRPGAPGLEVEVEDERQHGRDRHVEIVATRLVFLAWTLQPLRTCRLITHRHLPLAGSSPPPQPRAAAPPR